MKTILLLALVMSSSLYAQDSSVIKSIQSSLTSKDLLCVDVKTGIKYYASSLNKFLDSKDLDVSIDEAKSIINVKHIAGDRITSIDFTVNSDVSVVEEIQFSTVSTKDGNVISKISCY